METEENWWRVDFVEGSDPVAVRCEKRPEGVSAIDGAVICYVQAETMADAVKAASRQYDRVRVKARRDKYRAEGKCPCGRPPREGLKSCDVCAEQKSAYVERVKEGRTGVRDERARVAKFQATNHSRREALRLETLLLVRNKWRESKNIREFTSWLFAETQRALTNKPSQELTEQEMDEAILCMAAAIQEKRRLMTPPVRQYHRKRDKEANNGTEDNQLEYPPSNEPGADGAQ